MNKSLKGEHVDIPQIDYVLDNHAKTNIRIDEICNAIIDNDINKFNEFMKFNLNVDLLHSVNQMTMIMYAAQYGRFEMMVTLLKRGASIDNDRSQFRSALCFAMWGFHKFNGEHMKCILLLIKQGADIEILKECSMRVYHYAEFIKKTIEQHTTLSNDKLTLVDSDGVSYTIPKPKLKLDPPILIKVISDKQKTYPKSKLHGTVVAELYNVSDRIVKQNIVSDNVEIEIPIRNSYHLLPVGMIVNGAKLTEPIVCRFVQGYVLIGCEHESIAGLY